MSALPTTPFGAILIGASIAASAILVVALSLVKGPLRRRPALRSWVATVTLATLVFVPPTAWWAHVNRVGPGLAAGEVPTATTASMSTEAGSVRHAAPAAMPVDTTAEPYPAPIVSADRTSWAPNLAHVWLLGATIALLPVLVSYRRVRRLRASAVAIHDPAWNDLVDRIGTHGHEVRVSDRLSSPVTVGLRRPEVLLPRSMVERAPRSADEAVLAHELAHAARRDGLASLVERIGVALFWFHPAAWWLLRESAVAREEACDNHALRYSSPAELARSLLELSRRGATPNHGALIAGVRGWSLEERVRGLLDDARDTRSRAATRHAAWTGVALVALGVGAAACGTPHADDDESASASELQILREIGLVDDRPADDGATEEGHGKPVTTDSPLLLPRPLVALGVRDATTWTAEFTHDYGMRDVEYTLADGRPFPQETTWEFAHTRPVLEALAQCRTVSYRQDRWPGAKVEFDLRGTMPDGDVVVIGFHGMAGGATISRQSPDGTIVGGLWQYEGGDEALAGLLRRTVPAAVDLPMSTPIVFRVPEDRARDAYTIELLSDRAAVDRALEGAGVESGVPDDFDFERGVALVIHAPAADPTRTLRWGTPVLRHGRQIDLLVFDHQDDTAPPRTSSVMLQFVHVPDASDIESCRVHFHGGATRTLFR